MEFVKMNGAGNDFIIVNNMNGEISFDRWPEIVKLLCERHMSIGADGFMVVEKPDSKEADYKMLFFNSCGVIRQHPQGGQKVLPEHDRSQHSGMPVLPGNAASNP